MHVVRCTWKLYLNHVIFVGFGQACSKLSKITKPQYLWEGWNYFVYLMLEITYLWKLQCYHVV